MELEKKKPKFSFGAVFSKTWLLVKDAINNTWVDRMHEDTEFDHEQSSCNQSAAANILVSS